MSKYISRFKIDASIVALFIYMPFILLLNFNANAQVDSISKKYNAWNAGLIQQYSKLGNEYKKKVLMDSLEILDLRNQIEKTANWNKAKLSLLENKISALETSRTIKSLKQNFAIDSLRKLAYGFPVIGPSKDTVFYVYAKVGASTPSDRAARISLIINNLYENDLLKTDSIKYIHSENNIDIIYEDIIIMSISNYDAIFNNKSIKALAEQHTSSIKSSINKAKSENNLIKILIRTGLVLLVISIISLFIYLINLGHKKLLNIIEKNKSKWLRSLSYKDYVFMTEEQELTVLLFFMKIFRWFLYLILLYLSFPIIFSIFPFTRGYTNILIGLIYSPFHSVFMAIWEYLPNLFSIIIIYFVMRYFIRFVKYIFGEIQNEKLKINGFHPDWAMSTFGIIKFLLYAFMFVMIFPYLPGSNSDIFKGVSVFIGVLFSLGSSSAIANMVAGLVITYMRPFKIGDRIKIGEITGDVVEKTLLVTRLRTTKNEEITIPNSSMLNSNTTNYTSHAITDGLIIHSTVTIGYDVPWKDMHETLIEAAKRTQFIEKKPLPFVLQTSLEDFYVAYQINAYTKAPAKQALIYSNLHQNIQDVCNERGIEILSPHYRAARDGNNITIPASYLKPDYQAPAFNINMQGNNHNSNEKK
jgi:small-conductance mechanosensitive channel